jgi:photosystem II stability/assembly factor-like uncharacterized protein
VRSLIPVLLAPRRAAAVVALGLALAACSSGGPVDSDQSQVGEPATISHIHGLGVDSVGTPYVATHYGLIKAGTNGGWVYASADTNDHMGFSFHAADRVMYRSGHSFSKPSLGVESSADGAQWTHMSDVGDPPVDFHAMAVSFADSRTLWGWDSGGQGTFRSTDGGRTWTRLEAKGMQRQIYVLAGPAEPNVVFAGTATGLYQSIDGGTTWEAVQGTRGGWVIGIAADPSDAKHMLVFTQKGMKSTTDAGKTWTDAGGGLPSDVELTSVAISPADAKVAYASDSTRIFTTTDGGKTWNAVTTK